MRRVRIEEATAIGSEHLDRFLRSYRTLRNHLLRAFTSLSNRIGLEVLYNALRAKKQSGDQSTGKQNVDRSADQIDPEVTDGANALACKPSDECNGDGHAGRSGCEILHRKRCHLDEVTQCALARVGLPVCICQEAQRRVECKVGGNVCAVKSLRIER